jgi:hypothetical protein
MCVLEQSGTQAQVPLKKIVATAALLLALVIVPRLISAAYMESAGVLVTGKVVAKREAFLMPGGDTERHIFEITYEYQPGDAHYRETIVQRVDASFFRRHPVGSTVQVRYSPSRVLRSFAGIGLYLEDASPLSRLHYGPPDRADLIKTAELGLALILGLAAYRANSKALAGMAALLVGISFPDILLVTCAVLVFPLLFWAARRNPRKGYGIALLAAMALCAGVVYERVPRPAQIPPDRLRSGSAVVRQVRIVDEIWSDAWETFGRSSGQYLGPRFKMVELEYTPEEAREPIHVLDRIDLHSVPGLNPGNTLPVEFSSSDPEAVRIVGATRRYSRQLATELVVVTYGLGALVTFVVVPLHRRMRERGRSSAVLRALTDPEAAIARIAELSRRSRLPEDDPRRRAIESAVARLRARASRDGRK